MKWYLLKCFDGKWSGWHLCEACFDDARVTVVAAAMSANAYGAEPGRLTDPGRWHEAKMEDLAGTTVWELSCYECGEYEPNEDVLREEPEELGQIIDAFAVDGPPVYTAPKPKLKYFANMDPTDPDAPAKKKKPKFTEDDYFTQVLQAEMARARNAIQEDVAAEDIPW